MVQPSNNQPVGLGSDDLGQGGLFDAVLTIKSAKFQHRDFDGSFNGGRNFGVTLVYLKEDGTDQEWSYSVGDAAAWMATEDGLGAVPLKEGGKISQNSAFGVFLTELENAGFPKNRKTSTLDCLFGVQFQSKSFVPAGTNMEGGARKAILAPGLVTLLPGEVSGQQAQGFAAAPSMPVPPTPNAPATTTATTPTAPPPPPVTSPVSPNGTADVGQLALTSALKLGDTFTLQAIMAQTMQDYADNPTDRDAAAGFVFTPPMVELLTGAGYKVEGYQVSK